MQKSNTRTGAKGTENEKSERKAPESVAAGWESGKLIKMQRRKLAPANAEMGSQSYVGVAPAECNKCATAHC